MAGLHLLCCAYTCSDDRAYILLVTGELTNGKYVLCIYMLYILLTMKHANLQIL